MLLLVFLIPVITSEARTFKITNLTVPEVVPHGQNEAEIECRYDANFTLLNWFKGPNEFFRYKPGAAPSTRSFPILGVGRVELVHCGPTACRLRLGDLTEEATGLYRCDIEWDHPPYQFESETKYMQVYGHERRRPLLEGLADEYGEGDLIQAYCRGAPQSTPHWYMNGRELSEIRGSPSLQKNASRLLFSGIPPMLTVQCAESIYGKLSGSKEVRVRWKDPIRSAKDERPQEQSNSAIINKTNLFSVLGCIAFVQYKLYVYM